MRVSKDVKEAYIGQIFEELDLLEQKVDELPSRLENAVTGLQRASDGFKMEINSYMDAQKSSLASTISALATSSVKSNASIQDVLIRQAVAAALKDYEANKGGVGLRYKWVWVLLGLSPWVAVLVGKWWGA